MVKQSKILRLSALGVALAISAVAAPTVSAEVSASVSVANMYLWRGNNLGDSDSVGTPAISGDLNYSNSGFYTGVWVSSGDAAAGTEYDLYAGYGTEFGGLSVDLSIWTYTYPTGGDGLKDDPGQLSEVILSLAAGGFNFSFYENVAGDIGYDYYTLSYGPGDLSILYGVHNNDESPEDMAHVDLSYAYNDNLSFTLSQQVEDQEDQNRPKFVVSYSLPIDM